MSELPLAPIDRLIRKAGAYRVSEEATAALRKILEEIAIEISREAIELAHHAGRKTIIDDDIELATKRIQKTLRYGV